MTAIVERAHQLVDREENMLRLSGHVVVNTNNNNNNNNG
jgi:hypothetical protein